MQEPRVRMHVLYVIVGRYGALKIFGECSANITHTFAELVTYIRGLFAIYSLKTNMHIEVSGRHAFAERIRRKLICM